MVVKMQEKAVRRIKHLITHPYSQFVLKKVVFYLIVTFVGLTFIFALPRLMPGNPVDMMFAEYQPSPGAVSPIEVGRLSEFEKIKETMLEHFGFKKSLGEQYKDFWGQIFHLDLGISFKYYPMTVWSVMRPRIIFTLVLVIPILVISFFLGNWIGTRSAFLKGKSNTFVYYISILASSTPFYWFALLLMFFMAVKAGIFPIYGWSIPEAIPSLSFDFIIDALHHYALPFLVLFITFTGGWSLGMRSMTLYEMDSDYMLYAEQMGFRKKKLSAYAQRNAILPQFTGLNLRLSDLVGQTMIIEAIFGWPGLGYLGYEAVLTHDYPLLLGTFLIGLLIVIFGNFLIDITYGFVDPRIRTGYRR